MGCPATLRQGFPRVRGETFVILAANGRRQQFLTFSAPAIRMMMLRKNAARVDIARMDECP